MKNGDQSKNQLLAQLTDSRHQLEQLPKPKHPEERLLACEECFGRIFDASPALMVIFDQLDGTILEVNQRWLTTTGLRREEVLGHTYDELAICRDPEKRNSMLQQVQEQGSVHNVEIQYGTITGETGTLLVSASQIRFSGRQCVLIVASDITEARRLEREMAHLEQLNLVAELAAGISHEVRNPLTTVRGFLQILGAKPDCSQYKEYYDLMIDELDRANSILTEFLSLSKQEVSVQKVRNLNHIIQALLPLLQADALQQDKHILVESGDITDLLLSDKEIRQIILNLARNGLEAMSPGGKLIIKTYATDLEIILAVQDQGEGIPPKVLQKLGTPFITTKDRGTGLGLSVCFGIAARHQAVIQVDSGPTGTIFMVKFKRNCL